MFAAAAVALLALPAAASAERFSGETAQGKPVKIVSTPEGELRKATWRWQATCKRKGLRLRPMTTVLTTARRSKPGFFKGKGSYKVRARDARIRVFVAMVGRQKRPDRWTGTFKAKAYVDLKDGPKSVCKLRRIGWTAKS